MGIQTLGTSSGSILKLLLFPSFCTSFRKIPFASLFYMIFCFISYIYIYRPRARGDNSLGQFFWWKLKDLITLITGCMFQKNSSALWFYTHFFTILYMYIALVKGQTIYWGQIFDVNRKASSLWSFVASFKRISLTSDFIHIFAWVNKCI